MTQRCPGTSAGGAWDAEVVRPRRAAPSRAHWGRPRRRRRGRGVAASRGTAEARRRRRRARSEIQATRQKSSMQRQGGSSDSSKDKNKTINRHRPSRQMNYSTGDDDDDADENTRIIVTTRKRKAKCLEQVIKRLTTLASTSSNGNSNKRISLSSSSSPAPQLILPGRSLLAPTMMTTRSNSAAAAAAAAAAAQVHKDRAPNEMQLIREASRVHRWQWSETDKSHECVVGKDRLSLCFHPQCSESAAACRGSEPFRRNGNYYYWEIFVQDKIYGTSVMFGLCTKRQRLHANEYCNLIGLDEQGWSLSHKGLVWHQAKSRQYTRLFPINQPITIGLLYNTMRGELTYFMDGKNLGVAFSGLNDIDEDLYPVVGSTAKCTRMRLIGSYCGFVSLLERSCFTLLRSARNRAELIEYLRSNTSIGLPRNLLEYLAQEANVNYEKTSTNLATSTNNATTKRNCEKEQNSGAALNHNNYQNSVNCS